MMISAGQAPAQAGLVVPRDEGRPVLPQPINPLRQTRVSREHPAVVRSVDAEITVDGLIATTTISIDLWNPGRCGVVREPHGARLRRCVQLDARHPSHST